MSGQPATGSQYAHISTQTTGVLKSAPGSLVSVTINTKAATAVLTLFDNTAASGKVIAVIDCSGATQGLPFKLDFAVGLSYQLAGGNADVTVSFS